MPSAAILAGGRASRFGGRDKRALVVGGRSILEHQLAELSQITDDILIVESGEPIGGPARAAAIAGALAASVRVVTDRMPGLGPLGGLDAALAAARDERVIVIACDMPFITAPLVRHLVALSSAHDIVIPKTGRGYHPLCAVYSRACRALVTRQLAAGRLKMTDLLKEVLVREATAQELSAFGNPDHLLANVNTPAEYEELGTLQGHHG